MIKVGSGLQRIIAVILLGFVVQGYAQQPGPEPVRMPDIRANIMKMLQENKPTTESGEDDLFAEAERQRKAKQPPVEPAVKTEEPATPTVESPPQKANVKPKAAERPVELPIKEIVIEDLDDLKKLAEELRKAKKRQAGQQ